MDGLFCNVRGRVGENQHILGDDEGFPGYTVALQGQVNQVFRW